MNTKFWLIGIFVGLASLLSTKQVEADLLVSPGPTPGSPTVGFIPGKAKNELINPVYSSLGLGDPGGVLEGYYGATIGLSDRVDSLRFSFYGAEAGYTNEFQLKQSNGQFMTIYEGSPFSDDALNGQPDRRFAHDGGTDLPGTTALPISTSIFSTSLLDLSEDDFFRFYIPNKSAYVTNGYNPDDIADKADRNFFTHVLDEDNVKGLLLFLDDGGAGPDDNHDDMVILIEAFGASGTPLPPGTVPEPSSLALFSLMGLGALGMSGRRRRR